MPIKENWNIRSRSHTCTHTGRQFDDGEEFYTALFEDAQTEELVRSDYSIAAWNELHGQLHPFSFWKSAYTAPKNEAKQEAMEKETAETLLRRLVEEDTPGTENARYILAVMLERKKILKHTATRETEDANFLIYEHTKNGEVYLIRDPELKLDQVEEVQREVSILLMSGLHQAPPEVVAELDPSAVQPAPEAEPEAAGEASAEPAAVAGEEPEAAPAEECAGTEAVDTTDGSEAAVAAETEAESPDTATGDGDELPPAGEKQEPEV